MNNPKRTIFFIIISIVLSSISITASAKDKGNLAVNLGPIIKYESQDGKKFTARYGSLSDESLHFVKITMPDGNKYTLPQVLSAQVSVIQMKEKSFGGPIKVRSELI